MKVKKHKKVTPYLSEMLKKLKLTTPPQKFQLFVETFFKEIRLLSIRLYKTFYQISSLCDVKLSLNSFYCNKFDYINIQK